MHASKNHVSEWDFKIELRHHIQNVKCALHVIKSTVTPCGSLHTLQPHFFPAKKSLLIRHPIVVTRADVTAVRKSLLIPLFEESENGGAGVA